MGRGKNATDKKQKKGKNKEAGMSITEADHDRLYRILEQFRISKDKVYKFEENLPKPLRVAVHVLSQKMGLKSKSSGKGRKHRIYVFKFKNEVASVKEKESLFSFGFSEEAKYALQDLFSRFPSLDVEMAESKIGEISAKKMIKDMRWAKSIVKVYLILSTNGKLYHSSGQGPPIYVMEDVDSVDWSAKGNFVVVAKKNTISILSSMLKKRK